MGYCIAMFFHILESTTATAVMTIHDFITSHVGQFFKILLRITVFIDIVAIILINIGILFVGR
jgi:hypothetical protein